MTLINKNNTGLRQIVAVRLTWVINLKSTVNKDVTNPGNEWYSASTFSFTQVKKSSALGLVYEKNYSTKIIEKLKISWAKYI